MTPEQLDITNKRWLKVADASINMILNKRYNRKTIVEGMHLFLYKYPNKLKKHSVIVLGTPALKSMYRAYKRNIQDKEYVKDYGKINIFNDIRYNLFIKKVESFRKLVKSWK